MKDTPLCAKDAIEQGKGYTRFCVSEGGRPIGMVGRRSIAGGSFRLGKDKG